MYQPNNGKQTYHEYLLALSNALPSPLKEMCLDVIEDPRFRTAPGGASYHHDFEGGLEQHTAEVAYNAIEMASEYNRELLTVAAIFHDRNKIFEYEIAADGKIKKLPYRVLIGHLVGSCFHFIQRAQANRLDQEFIDKVTHVMLAHHGRHEWRSPVEPQTPEAFILHSADMLSAR